MNWSAIKINYKIKIKKKIENFPCNKSSSNLIWTLDKLMNQIVSNNETWSLPMLRKFMNQFNLSRKSPLLNLQKKKIMRNKITKQRKKTGKQKKKRKINKKLRLQKRPSEKLKKELLKLIMNPVRIPIIKYNL